MELFSPKIKKFLTFSQKKGFLTFWGTQALNFLHFLKKGFFFYFLKKMVFLYFLKKTFFCYFWK